MICRHPVQQKLKDNGDFRRPTFMHRCLTHYKWKERLEASDCQLAVFCQCRAQSAYPPPPPGCRRHLPHDCLILSPRRHVHPPLSILSCQPYQLGKYKIINHPGRRPKKNSALTRSLPYSAAAAAAVGWRQQRNSRRCGGM